MTQSFLTLGTTVQTNDVEQSDRERMSCHPFSWAELSRALQLTMASSCLASQAWPKYDVSKWDTRL